MQEDKHIKPNVFGKHFDTSEDLNKYLKEDKKKIKFTEEDNKEASWPSNY